MAIPSIDFEKLLVEAQSKKAGRAGGSIDLQRASGYPFLPINPWMLAQPIAGPKTREEPTAVDEEILKLEATINGLKKELSACRGQIYGLCEDLKARPSIKQTQLMDIGEEFELMQPISIVLEESEERVIASFPEVELFAVGNTESEAILNLKSSIIGLFADLTGTPKSELGKLPRAWLRVLNKVIKPIGKD